MAKKKGTRHTVKARRRHRYEIWIATQNSSPSEVRYDRLRVLDLKTKAAVWDRFGYDPGTYYDLNFSLVPCCWDHAQVKTIRKLRTLMREYDKKHDIDAVCVYRGN